MKLPTIWWTRLHWLPATAWCAAVALVSRADQIVSPDTALPPTAVPPRLVWPGVVVIIVIAIFVTAALAGPLIRANSDEQPDPAPPDNAESP